MNIKLSIVSLALISIPVIAQDEAPQAQPETQPVEVEDLGMLLIPSVTIDPDANSKIRVARTHSGQLLFPAVVNGQDLGWWLLDTGASDNVMDLRAAKEVGLENSGIIVMRDFTGVEQTTPLFADVSIVIGNCTIEQPRIAGVDMLPISSMVGQPVIGIIGCSTLSQLVLTVDYLAPVVHIEHADSFDGEELEWTDVDFDNQSPIVKGTFEGHEGTFAIDTGLALAVDFSRDTVAEHAMTEDRETRDWVSIGVGGRAEVQMGFIESFEFLGVKHGQLPAIFEDPDGFEGSFPNQSGMVGSLILRHYVTTFDLSRGRIAFTPVDRAGPAEDLFLADIVGTYRDRGVGGTMVIDWDGETVKVILGAGQPQLDLVVLADGSFYFPGAWIYGKFITREGILMGMEMKLPDGQYKKAFKMD